MEVREKRVVNSKREGDRFGPSLGVRPMGTLMWLIHTDPRLDLRHTLHHCCCVNSRNVHVQIQSILERTMQHTSPRLGN